MAADLSSSFQIEREFGKTSVSGNGTFTCVVLTCVPASHFAEFRFDEGLWHSGNKVHNGTDDSENGGASPRINRIDDEFFPLSLFHTSL